MSIEKDKPKEDHIPNIPQGRIIEDESKLPPFKGLINLDNDESNVIVNDTHHESLVQPEKLVEESNSQTSSANNKEVQSESSKFITDDQFFDDFFSEDE